MSITLKLYTQLEGRGSESGYEVYNKNNIENISLFLYNSANTLLYKSNSYTNAYGVASYDITNLNLSNDTIVKLWVKGERYLAILFESTVNISDNIYSIQVPRIMAVGDINNDNTIDEIDFKILQSAILTNDGSSDSDYDYDYNEDTSNDYLTITYDARADLNNDGSVDLDDFTLFKHNLGLSSDKKPGVSTNETAVKTSYEELSITIDKDKSWRNICNDLDKILTVLSNTIKVDFSDKSIYPTLTVVGDFSDDYGVVALSSQKLRTPRKIELIGNATGSSYFDGSKDIQINTTVSSINGVDVSEIIEPDGRTIKNATNVTTSIKDVLISDLFEMNGDSLSDRNTALRAVDAYNVTDTIAGHKISDVFTLIGDKYVCNYTTNIIDSSGEIFDGSDCAYKSRTNTFTNTNIFSSSVTLNNRLLINFKNNDAGCFNSGTYVPNATNRLNYNGNLYTTNLLATTGVTIGNVSIDNSGNLGGTNRLNVNGYIYATRVYNAVYNADYAECFEPSDNFIYEENLYRIVSIENGKIVLSKKNDNRVVGVVSDNYGYMLSGTQDEIDNNKKIPVGLAGTLYVDTNKKVTKSDLYKFITSDDNGKALVIDKLNTDSFGTIVGKIIDVDKKNNRYKIIISLN